MKKKITLELTEEEYERIHCALYFERVNDKNLAVLVNEAWNEGEIVDE